MIKIFNKYRLCFFLAVSIFCVCLSSCSDKKQEEPPAPEPVVKEMTILFYDICSESSMASNFNSDRAEILKIASTLDLEHNTFLVYSVLPPSSSLNPTLEILEEYNGEFRFKVVKNFDRNQYSTDPERIKEVLSIVREEYEAEKYGFIAGAHGSSWTPSYSTHVVPEAMATALGGDTNNGDDYDYIDVDEFSEIFPDGMMEFIWFDACYMGGVEVAYQLRDKCRYFIGYVTEIYIPGMPYDLTVPLLLSSEPKIMEAAKATYDYYNDDSKAVTVAVVDSKKMEGVAAATKKVFSMAPQLSSSRGLQKYSRYGLGPYYDFGQLVKLRVQKELEGGENASLENAYSEFLSAMENAVVYKAASAHDFNSQPIEADNYSGLSTHFFKETEETDENAYYKTLDWYKAAY